MISIISGTCPVAHGSDRRRRDVQLRPMSSFVDFIANFCAIAYGTRRSPGDAAISLSSMSVMFAGVQDRTWRPYRLRPAPAAAFETTIGGRRIPDMGIIVRPLARRIERDAGRILRFKHAFSARFAVFIDYEESWNFGLERGKWNELPYLRGRDALMGACCL